MLNNLPTEREAKKDNLLSSSLSRAPYCLFSNNIQEKISVAN